MKSLLAVSLLLATSQASFFKFFKKGHSGKSVKKTTEEWPAFNFYKDFETTAAVFTWDSVDKELVPFRQMSMF